MRIPSYVVVMLALAILTSFTPLNVESQELIYKQGDWIKYRIRIIGIVNGMSINCSYILEVHIVLVYEGLVTVSYDIGLEGGGDLCYHLLQELRKDYTMETIVPENQSPSTGHILVDPAYDGVYRVDPNTRLEYRRGVLIKGVKTVSKSSDTAYVMSMELVDTSIDQLKPAGTSGKGVTLLDIAVLLAVTLSVISLALLIYVLRILKRVSRLAGAQEGGGQRA